MFNSQTALLIDGDIIAYKAATSSEVPIQWDQDLWTLHSDLNDAKRAFQALYEAIRDNLPSHHVLFAFSSKKNFRYSIWQDYKSNRKNKRLPLTLAALKEWIKTAYTSVDGAGLEADDILGILATDPVTRDHKVIVSIDKDFKTVPCNLCDTRTWKIRPITEEDADYAHMFQTLTGDSADGYPGCPTYGPVKAKKILGGATTYKEMWPLVVEAYAKQGLGEDYALTMARLARICRRGDYNFKKKEVILWNPPSLKK